MNLTYENMVICLASCHFLPIGFAMIHSSAAIQCSLGHRDRSKSVLKASCAVGPEALKMTQNFTCRELSKELIGGMKITVFLIAATTNYHQLSGLTQCNTNV